MEVKPVQPEKAANPIDVTLLGIIVFWHPLINWFVAVSMMALQLSRESYTGLLLLTSIDVMLLHAEYL